MTRAELADLAERSLPIRGVLTRQILVDPDSNQVFVTGVADDGQEAIFAARLRFDESRLLEAETLVTHEGESSIVAPKSLFERTPVAPLDPRDRTPRSDMIAAADAYFDAIEHERPGDSVPFHPECDRIENGAQTTRNPAFLGGLGAVEQLDPKVFAYIERMRARRYPLADEETGQLLAIVFLDVSGKVTEFELGGRRVPLPPHVRQPRSTLMSEVFRSSAGSSARSTRSCTTCPTGRTRDGRRSPRARGH